MKRIKYISRFARDLDAAEIEALVEQARKNNEKNSITGILIASGLMFFQVIEGPEDAVDGLFARILEDGRHRDVLVINSEQNVQYRMYPDWSLKKMDLGMETTLRTDPLRVILETVIESRTHLEKLTGALERAIWNEIEGSD